MTPKVPGASGNAGWLAGQAGARAGAESEPTSLWHQLDGTARVTS